MFLVFVEADKKQQQPSSDGDPGTSTNKLQGAPTDRKREICINIFVIVENEVLSDISLL